MSIENDIFGNATNLEDELFGGNDLESDLFAQPLEDDLFVEDTLEDDLFPEDDNEDTSITVFTHNHLPINEFVEDEAYSFYVDELEDVRVSTVGEVGKAARDSNLLGDDTKIIVISNGEVVAYWSSDN